MHAEGFVDDCSVSMYRAADGIIFLHPGEANRYLMGKVVNAPLRSSSRMDDPDCYYGSEFLPGLSALVL